MQVAKEIQEIQINSDVVLFTNSDLPFMKKKRYENNLKIDEIYAHFVIKYKKNTIMTSDITSYEEKVWKRFDEKAKKIDTLCRVLEEGRTAAVSLKEYHFLFEEMPKLYF